MSDVAHCSQIGQIRVSNTISRLSTGTKAQSADHNTAYAGDETPHSSLCLTEGLKFFLSVNAALLLNQPHPSRSTGLCVCFDRCEERRLHVQTEGKNKRSLFILTHSIQKLNFLTGSGKALFWQLLAKIHQL